MAATPYDGCRAFGGCRAGWAWGTMGAFPGEEAPMLPLAITAPALVLPVVAAALGRTSALSVLRYGCERGAA